MKLSTHGLYIEISPARAADDEDWCRVHVAAEANGFTGRFEAWLQVGDLVQFQRELLAMHESVGRESTATLSSAEPGIRIELVMHALGGITGQYELESERRDGTATNLSGAFELDQSYLPSIQEGVGGLVEQLQGKNLI